MNEDLHEWLMENKPLENMVWKTSFWNQAIFVRDRLPWIFFNDYKTIEKNTWRVIGTHTSKSIILPVYYLKLETIKIIMRNNFYNWKVSIESDYELIIDPVGLFNPIEKIHLVYCEGFKDSWVFDSYNMDKKRFTIEINDDYRLYTFLFLLNKA